MIFFIVATLKIPDQISVTTARELNFTFRSDGENNKMIEDEEYRCQGIY